MISVVIRNKNQDKALSFLLKTLTERYIEDIDEIIVIDNMSSDKSKELTDFYGARLVTIKEFSYGASANLAANEAKNDIIVIFSSHSYPISHDFFKLIKKKFKNRIDLAGVRCLHSPNDYRNYINNVSAKVDPNKSGLIFSGSAFSKRVWKEYSFNENVATFEDKEWSKRVLNAGYLIEFVPSIFSYEIKRTKKQEFFRFKNDLIGDYQLWHMDVTVKNSINGLIMSLFRSAFSFFESVYYSFKRFFYVIRFILKKPDQL
ncbi:glycosyltransferase [Bizionia saleffrena]|uniref:Glycosyltransferase n=1 Tax=Bizionia saleffrena TaxID=291189 RepID=A0A8H2LJA9_9FLAO|nr:glycosyltransferase [Bizionia saleffrena]TYB80166.1 glycosyltransferase [Bizionia saleffrena]